MKILNNKSLLRLLLLIILPVNSYGIKINSTYGSPAGINYEKLEENNHIIHIITIDPKYYNFKLVKAHNQVFGRETVDMIAKRTGAIAAINAGFFEIAGCEDGRPSGALIIDNEIFGLSKGIRSLLMLNDNIFSIIQGNIIPKVIIGNKTYLPNHTNIFANNADVVLYNYLWSNNSLTNYERTEVIIDKDLIVENIINHGGNNIPYKGYVLSFPKDYDLSTLSKGLKVEIKLSMEGSYLGNTIMLSNVVMGIPMIVKEGKIINDLHKYSSSGYSLPHARTALGIKKNGKVVMLVAEHTYSQKLKQMNLEQVRDILLKNGYSRSSIDTIKSKELLGILQNHLSKGNLTVGLNITELANLMIKLDCENAINLDGGGSSTIFLKDKIINTSVGDQDEAFGEKVIRPVSDAIIVIKK